MRVGRSGFAFTPAVLLQLLPRLGYCLCRVRRRMDSDRRPRGRRQAQILRRSFIVQLPVELPW